MTKLLYLRYLLLACLIAIAGASRVVYLAGHNHSILSSSDFWIICGLISMIYGYIAYLAGFSWISLRAFQEWVFNDLPKPWDTDMIRASEKCTYDRLAEMAANVRASHVELEHIRREKLPEDLPRLAEYRERLSKARTKLRSQFRRFKWCYRGARIIGFAFTNEMKLSLYSKLPHFAAKVIY